MLMNKVEFCKTKMRFYWLILVLTDPCVTLYEFKELVISLGFNTSEEVSYSYWFDKVKQSKSICINPVISFITFILKDFIISEADPTIILRNFPKSL